MTRTLTPTTANRTAAREMLPGYSKALLTAYATALKPLAAVAGTQGEASPALVVDALVELRLAKAVIAKAEADLLGTLVLAGQARVTLARTIGRRPEALAAKLLLTPAGWCGAELVRDPSAVGGWRR